MSPEQTSPPDIVLIHGLWMTPRSWEQWKERYESRGHTVHAPAWPGMEASVEELNENPEPIAQLDLEEIVDHYAAVIGACERPPPSGSSRGGLISQERRAGRKSPTSRSSGRSTALGQRCRRRAAN